MILLLSYFMPFFICFFFLFSIFFSRLTSHRLRCSVLLVDDIVAIGLFKNFMVINLVPAIASTLLFITFFFMPESPRYLSIRGNAKRANEILVKFKTDDRAIQNDLQLWTSAHHKIGYLSVFKEEFNIAYAIPVFGLYIFEQLIGAVPILFYLQKIFKLTGKKI